MTDIAGVVVWSADYKPFGEANVTVSTITNNLRFPGQYYDAETGLHFNYFRDYSPIIGRYIESDPILKPILMNARNIFIIPFITNTPKKLSDYVYVSQNPLGLTDVLGLWCGSGLSEQVIPDNYIFWNFSKACEHHDDCYAKCGKSQGSCDFALLKDMLAACSQSTPLPGVGVQCLSTAFSYYAAVTLFGKSAYDSAQKNCCYK